MGLDDIPLFSMLKGRMGYLTQRQQLIAENVANSDTPGYAPRDLKPFSFAAKLEAATGVGPVAPARTSAMHLAGKPVADSGGWKPKVTPDSETKLDGNQVVLEEEMMKMSDAKMNYDAAVNIYEKAIAMLRTAAKAPGK